MNTQFRLNAIVFHYIGFEQVETEEPGVTEKVKYRKQAAALQDLTALDDVITGRLLALIQDAWDRPDTGDVRSARFHPDPPKPEMALLRGYLDGIEEDVWSQPPGDAAAATRFLVLSQQIDDRLYDCTPLSASPGLLMVADFSPPGQVGRYLALLKIRHEDQHLVHILQSSLTDLSVQEVEMILTRDVLKGVIWPHPSRPGYDLKLIDYQARSGPPAQFFAVTFLGCTPKEADTRQAAALPVKLPSDVARELGATLIPGKTARYVHDLVESTRPSAQQVADIASASGLIVGAEPEQMLAAVEERLAHKLPAVEEARQLESELASLAADEGWTYDPDGEEAFRRDVDAVLALDGEKVAGAMVGSGLVVGTNAQAVRSALEARGVLDVPRKALFQRIKTLRYRFRVPLVPGSSDFRWVTISGPRETMQRLLRQDKGGNHVFSITASPENFKREYR